MARECHICLHLIEFLGKDVGIGILLSINHTLLKTRINF